MYKNYKSKQFLKLIRKLWFWMFIHTRRKLYILVCGVSHTAFRDKKNDLQSLVAKNFSTTNDCKSVATWQQMAVC